jgi:hypothetical protein
LDEQDAEDRRRQDEMRRRFEETAIANNPGDPFA